MRGNVIVWQGKKGMGIKKFKDPLKAKKFFMLKKKKGYSVRNRSIKL